MFRACTKNKINTTLTINKRDLYLILYFVFTFFFQVTKWDTEQYGSNTTTITTTNSKISNKK